MNKKEVFNDPPNHIQSLFEVVDIYMFNRLKILFGAAEQTIISLFKL